MWGRQVLATVGVSVGFLVQLRVVVFTVVSPVESPGGPIKMEFIMGGVATQPIKPHVHIFGLTRHDCVVSNAGGGGFVTLKGRRWLQPTNFNECLA